MVAMTTFKATVERDGRFWAVKVAGVGATQARHLRELDEMTFELIEIMTERAEFEVEYQFILPESVERHLALADELREKAALASAQASEETRAAVLDLRELGLPFRDIGRILGVSYQRIQQLASERKLPAVELPPEPVAGPRTKAIGRGR
jgi:DNA-directed RNA polymerase specialized sigma24 family protein